MQKTAHLKVTDGFGVQKTIPLLKPVFTIGRKIENDLQVMSNSVSRHHGAIVCENGVYYLVDKGSKTGTFINGQRVERSALCHLDRISLGAVDDYKIQFIAPDQALEQFSSVADQASGSAERQKAATAKEELKNLARYVEVNQAFKFSLEADDVLRLIVDAAVELAAAERGLIMLMNQEGKLEFKVARDNKRSDVPRKDFALSTSVVKQVLRKNQTVVLGEGLRDRDFEPGRSVSHLDLRKVICVPLHRFQMQANIYATSSVQFKLIGVLYLDSRSISAMLSKTSIKLLESLAFEASKAFENVRLMHEEQEKQRLEHEFQMARDVQVALSPVSSVKSNHFELAAHSIPCRDVGGDFYDLLTLSDGRVVLTLADVSGKGISAALLASLAQGIIEAEFYQGHSPAEVLEILNRVILNRSEANRFITMFCAVLDSEGSLTWVNAGHNPPILARHGGETETLSTQSLMLGAFDFAEYRVSNTRLGPGDLVFSFTDGVTEAVNSSGDFFGDERLLELVRKSINLTAEQIKNRVLEEVLDFTRGLPQGDDITVVALKMK
jgi:sigma-B regulation protein RsbU (phosphoserine phosphatase)